ncbi:Cupin 1 [Rhabdaerophilaceae bacterium]
MVHRGTFGLKFRDGRDIRLRPGDVYVVPRGVEHFPYAEEETEVIFFDRCQRNIGLARPDECRGRVPSGTILVRLTPPCREPAQGTRHRHSHPMASTWRSPSKVGLGQSVGGIRFV